MRNRRAIVLTENLKNRGWKIAVNCREADQRARLARKSNAAGRLREKLRRLGPRPLGSGRQRIAALQSGLFPGAYVRVHGGHRREPAYPAGLPIPFVPPRTTRSAQAGRHAWYWPWRE